MTQLSGVLPLDDGSLDEGPLESETELPDELLVDDPDESLDDDEPDDE